MKKRTGTKALSIALAAALCMTGLAGCGSKTQETQGSKDRGGRDSRGVKTSDAEAVVLQR